MNKVNTLLKQDVCVSIVDVVSTKQFNLYSELLSFIDGVDTNMGVEPSPLYAVTIRCRDDKQRQWLDTWFYPFDIGQSLPTLPIWLSKDLSVPLDLESSYEDTCRSLRIP